MQWQQSHAESKASFPALLNSLMGEQVGTTGSHDFPQKNREGD
jgi:hypothetical protein